MAGQLSIEPQGATAGADDVFVTHELASRPAKNRDYRSEKDALQDLAARLSDDPEAVLPRFVELAMDLTGAASAGLSIFEPAADGPGLFRWKHLHGALATFEGATTPRNDSPCGVTLDRKGPLLARNPERIYDWIAAAGIVIPEVLLVPLFISEQPIGTLWVVADRCSHFRQEDAEVATELARFVAVALRIINSEDELRNALRRQELLAREMGHRVKNVIAVTESIVRLTAERADSMQSFAQSLSRRLNALSAAHALARSTGTGDDAVVSLRELSEAIVAPFSLARTRFSLSGPDMDCGPHSATALALVINELTTNAAKYGALSTPTGNVEIKWSVSGDRLELEWRETGGPPIEANPQSSGFGSTLIQRTVTRQFSGTLDEEWRREGLVCKMTLALRKVSL